MAQIVQERIGKEAASSTLLDSSDFPRSTQNDLDHGEVAAHDERIAETTTTSRSYAAVGASENKALTQSLSTCKPLEIEGTAYPEKVEQSFSIDSQGLLDEPRHAQEEPKQKKNNASESMGQFFDVNIVEEAPCAVTVYPAKVAQSFGINNTEVSANVCILGGPCEEHRYVCQLPCGVVLTNLLLILLARIHTRTEDKCIKTCVYRASKH